MKIREPVKAGLFSKSVNYFCGDMKDVEILMEIIDDLCDITVALDGISELSSR